MDCERIRELLMTDHMDGETDVATAAAVEAHLASCPGCRSFRERLGAVSAPLRNAARAVPPAELWERVRGAAETPEPRGRWGFLPETWRLPALSFAAAALALAAVLVSTGGRGTAETETAALAAATNEYAAVTAYVTSADDGSLGDDSVDFGTAVEEYLL